MHQNIHKQPSSTTFQFVLDHQQVFTNLDHIKLNDFDNFLRIGQVGKQIQSLAKANDYQQLSKLVDKNSANIPFMRMQIEDAMVTAFHLRNQQTIRYFLQNGIKIDQLIPDAVMSVTYSLEYLVADPPLQLLQLILQYGANPRYAQQQNCNTAMHLACKHGVLKFVEVLRKYGADINAVNNDKLTPLAIAMAHKRHKVVQFMQSINASKKWNQ